MNDKDCIFCRIIRKELPSAVVYEDELVLAFMDIKPVNKGHVLVIPKSHHKFISDVPADEAARMFEVARKINTAVRKSGIKCEGVNFMLSDGEAATQEVFHSHLHCIPRFKGDGFRFVFPEGWGTMADSGELKTLAEKISGLL